MNRLPLTSPDARAAFTQANGPRDTTRVDFVLTGPPREAPWPISTLWFLNVADVARHICRVLDVTPDLLWAADGLDGPDGDYVIVAGNPYATRVVAHITHGPGPKAFNAALALGLIAAAQPAAAYHFTPVSTTWVAQTGPMRVARPDTAVANCIATWWFRTNAKGILVAQAINSPTCGLTWTFHDATAHAHSSLQGAFKHLTAISNTGGVICGGIVQLAAIGRTVTFGGYNPDSGCAVSGTLTPNPSLVIAP